MGPLCSQVIKKLSWTLYLPLWGFQHWASQRGFVLCPHTQLWWTPAKHASKPILQGSPNLVGREAINHSSKQNCVINVKPNNRKHPGGSFRGTNIYHILTLLEHRFFAMHQGPWAKRASHANLSSWISHNLTSLHNLNLIWQSLSYKIPCAIVHHLFKSFNMPFRFRNRAFDWSSIP